jgi:hypothetical protein
MDGISPLVFLLVLFVHSQHQFLRTSTAMLLEVHEQTLISEIERMRIFPIVPGDT